MSQGGSRREWHLIPLNSSMLLNSQDDDTPDLYVKGSEFDSRLGRSRLFFKERGYVLTRGF